MPSINQKIFKGPFVAELRDQLRFGQSLCEYFKQKIDCPADAVFESTIKVDPAKLGLRYRGSGESASNDIENAIALYEAFPDLSETQASDPRLWVYLTHVALRDYVMARWPLPGSCEQAMQDKNAKISAINFVLAHWFTSGNDRLLRRNAVARLWWAVHLTKSPWERSPEFSDLRSDDPYRFTRVLLLTQDIYQQVLERGFGRDNRMLITILEFIEAHPDIKREPIRDLMKELNLELTVKNFSILSGKELKETIFEMGKNLSQLHKNKVYSNNVIP